MGTIESAGDIIKKRPSDSTNLFNNRNIAISGIAAGIYGAALYQSFKVFNKIFEKTFKLQHDYRVDAIVYSRNWLRIR